MIYAAVFAAAFLVFVISFSFSAYAFMTSSSVKNGLLSSNFTSDILIISLSHKISLCLIKIQALRHFLWCTLGFHVINR